MNPKKFLLTGGVVLLVLGVLGYLTGGDVDPYGPLYPTLWLTGGENLAHVVLGVAGILAAYLLGEGGRKWLTIILGVVALYYGVIGLTLGVTNAPAMNYKDVANLEMLDNVIHLVVGVWALWAASKKESMMGV